MKKVACLGMATLLAFSVGCGKDEAPVEVVTPEVVEVVEVPEEEEKLLKIADLKESDFEPFFKALYGYSEGDFDRLNRNDQVTYDGYFNDLQFYREKLNQGLGKYFSESLKEQLEKEDIKLLFDLPKKVAINDYIVEASGEVEKVEIKSSREIGEHLIYEVAVTSNHAIMKESTFLEQYGWSDKLGYYAQRGDVDDAFFVPEVLLEYYDDNDYFYAQHEDISDRMKVVSSYWVEVSEPIISSMLPFQVEELTQAGEFEVSPDAKQNLNNHQYVERIPYYEEASDKQKKIVTDVMSKLLEASEESHLYYKKVYSDSFTLYQQYWEELGIMDSMTIVEETYKDAFPTTINPYKDNIEHINFDAKKMQITPSIYSTQLQPNFIVTIPVEALKKNNETGYYAYKYMVCTEEDKVESIVFLKMVEMTQEEFEQFGTVPEEETVEGEATTEGAVEGEVPASTEGAVESEVPASTEAAPAQ